MRSTFDRLARFGAENIIAAISLVVAALSLIISLFGLFNASRAQTYTENLESNRRAIILIGDTGDQQDGLKVAPLQPAMQFLSGYAYFPDEIIDGAVPIDAQGKTRWMGSIIGGIEDHLSVSTPASDSHVSIVESGIPVIIYSYYAFEGEVREDYSLYNATFLGQVASQQAGGTKAALTGLIYGQRLNKMSEDEAKALSNDIWNSMKSQKFGLPEMSE